ncbi:MAG: hypothetical protein Q8R82_07470 [Hyphomonadaceae bacterium]|nr:hypothetical protein [Hyphomonadaceae bacterium]
MTKLIVSGLAALIALAACTTTPEPAPLAFAADTPAPVASADPRVKFKDGERYLLDLSANLNMPREDICKELSRYDCMTDAFRIVLGGVEAPNLLVNEPIENAALTSPIAVDRVALHVCSNRVRMDREKPTEAVLFKTGAFGADGRAKSPDTKWLNATADAIYGSILMRSPGEREIQNLAAYYTQVAEGRPANSADVAADWVTLSCFAVASSLEAVFY